MELTVFAVHGLIIRYNCQLFEEIGEKNARFNHSDEHDHFFLFMGYDKLQAKVDGRRIPERVLLILGVLAARLAVCWVCKYSDTRPGINTFDHLRHRRDHPHFF